MGTFARRLASAAQVRSVGLRPTVTTAHRTCGHYNGSPKHCHPSTRTLHEHLVHNVPLCRVSALISLVGLISLHANCSVNNFSTSGVGKTALRLKVKGTSRPFRNVNENILGVRKLPMCESRVKNVNAPADSGRQAGVKLSAARVLTVIGKCDNTSKLTRTTSVVRRLLGGCTNYSDTRLFFFRWLSGM